ncbi:LPXTG-motif cell wall anchor domain-containing protein [Streptomyces sp. Ncost-T6T-2b]|nr:LPXTG-motif cell wall anchor domain-containing protein [Streptomyces sp. Ncost-T6T-2b]
MTHVDIRIPKGTSVVKPHGFCDAVTKTHYRCGTSQSWVDVNHGESYDFVLRIDKAVGRTTGEVSFTGQERPFDRNAENDTAQIVIDTGEDEGTAGSSGSNDSTGGTGGTSSTGGSGSTGSTGSTGGTTGSSGGSADTGGSTTGGATPQTGGNLAATGSDSTGPLIGMAAAAVAAGGGILWAVRRRSAAQGG